MHSAERHDVAVLRLVLLQRVWMVLPDELSGRTICLCILGSQYTHSTNRP